jgi:DNA polymerase-3 subunit chi
MTEILFLHSVADRHQAAAAWLEGSPPERKVGVLLSDSSTLDCFEQLLWTHNSTSFLPHCQVESTLAEHTSILLGCSVDNLLDSDCLVNLSSHVPGNFSRFRELVEVISTSDSEKASGRERFRLYRELGFTIDSQDYSNGGRV